MTTRKGPDRVAILNADGTFDDPKVYEKLGEHFGELSEETIQDVEDLKTLTEEGRLSEPSLNATYGTVDDTLILPQLAAAAAADRQRAVANSQIAYADNASFIESWTDLTGWTLHGTPGMQVSDGRLYSTGSGGGNSGANHSLSPNATGSLVFKTEIAVVSGGASGGLIIGVSKDTAGGVPAAAGANARGIYFRANSTNIDIFDGAASTTLGQYSTGTYYVTVTVDADSISIVAVRSTGNGEFRVRFSRTGFGVNNLYIFNSDTRGLTGHSVGKVGATKALTSIAPRTGVEDIAPRWMQFKSKSGAGLRFAFPANYDARKPSPVVFCFHGNDSDETLFADNTNGSAVANAFIAAGFICVSAAYTAASSTWGSDNGLAAYVTAYQELRTNWALGPIVFYANSMGAIESLLTLAARRIPCVAWVGSVPAVNLAANYANPTFTATIRTAYGIAGDDSDYAAKTDGHDPMLLAPAMFRGLPMYVMVATDDASVDPAANWDAFEPLIEPLCPDYVRVDVTGGHSTSAIASGAAAMVAFAQQYAR